jgi:imidazolonepropionase-like amidohydrolase/sugar lactone lactonase YvrE
MGWREMGESMNKIAILVATLLCATAGNAQVSGPKSRTPLARGTFAITNVNVLPMTRDTVIQNAVVIVRDGRIATVGAAAAVRIPANTRRIDGGGGYLLPGFADMHTHLYSDGVVPDSAAPAELGVLIANGITTVRLMAGTPEQLALRTRVLRGEVAGPQLWLASPMFANREGDNTRVITSADDARAAVREAVSAGYDFIKNTFGITGDVYEAMIDEAKRAGIGVVGHVEPSVGVARALAAGQQIEHLDAYFEAALADSAPMTASVTQYGIYQPQNWRSLAYIDDRKITELAHATARAGIYTGPTLEIFNRAFGDPLTDEQLAALPDWNMIPEAIRGPYMRSRQNYWAQPVPLDERKRFAELRSLFVKRIHEAGGKIIAGSDSPDLLMAYGFSYHRELRQLVRAGLRPYEALVAATRNPAEYLGALNEFGTIQPGRRADLVLVTANPLADINNTQRISSVFIGGAQYTRSQLDAMLTRAARAIDGVARSNLPARRVHALEGFEIPESVMYDEDLDAYFVTNITAHATRKDNTGYISKLRPDGTIESKKFIAGGQNGSSLHAPKGMAIRGDTLWVVDVDSVRAFNKRTGAYVTAIDLTPHKPLLANDVAYGPDGTLYISETGLQFSEPSGARWTTEYRLMRRTAGGAVEVVLQDTTMAGPNGLLWDPSRNALLIGSLRTTPVLTWKPGETTATVLARGTGGYDGIARSSNGRIFLSSHDGESILELVRNNNGTSRLTRVIDGVPSAGDIGYDTRRNRVLIPLLNAGRVEIWQIE